MARYSNEQKEAIIQKMMPPHNCSVKRLAKETGISDATLYTWRKQAKGRGNVVPGDGKNPENWSAEDKFATVLETAQLNQAEMSEYCRKNGVYVEQVMQWKQACLNATSSQKELEKQALIQSKADKKRIKELEKDLQKKEKALAETAALLVLRKKANAIWGESEDE